MATRWSRCCARESRAEDGCLSGQLRSADQWTPGRRRTSTRHLRQAHRRRRGQPRQAATPFYRRGTHRADLCGAEGTRSCRGGELYGPHRRVRTITGRNHAGEGFTRLLRLRCGASAGAHEPKAGPRHSHRVPHVELRTHLCLVKYLERHRQLWWERVRPRAPGGCEGAEGEVQIKVDELLDHFEQLVHNARHVPLSNQVMINEDEAMELVDQIRFNLPDEIKQANWTVSEQQRIITEAHGEAARIMSRANERAEETSSDHEVLRRAERQATQLVKEAQTKSDRIVQEAESYALEQLKQLEAHLGRTLATVRRGVEALQSSQPEPEESDQAAST